MDELNRRKLNTDDRETMEGAITKKELTTQLIENHHMKANSTPGLDGFTVAWVRLICQTSVYQQSTTVMITMN